MTRSEFYGAMAEQAALEAENASERMKPDLLLIAERWRALADLVEAHEFAEPADVERQSANERKPGEQAG